MEYFKKACHAVTKAKTILTNSLLRNSCELKNDGTDNSDGDEDNDESFIFTYEEKSRSEGLENLVGNIKKKYGLIFFSVIILSVGILILSALNAKRNNPIYRFNPDL